MRLLLAIAAVADCGTIIGCATAQDCPSIERKVETGAAPRPYSEVVRDPSGPLLVVGDTQRTSKFECRLRGREVNVGLSEAAFSEIAALKPSPSAVVIMGDLLPDAAEPGDWWAFDRMMTPIVERGIPVLPLRGIHEYWPVLAQSLAEVQIVDRFPWLRERLYESRRQG